MSRDIFSRTVNPVGPCAPERPLNLKSRGDFAELMVAVDLLRHGYKIAIPYGEDCDFDLVLIRGNQLERVQVKHARADGSVIARSGQRIGTRPAETYLDP